MLLNTEEARLGVAPRHAVHIDGVSYVGRGALRRYPMVSLQISIKHRFAGISAAFFAHRRANSQESAMTGLEIPLRDQQLLVGFLAEHSHHDVNVEDPFP
jgi:hypothetical protein